MSLTLNPLTPDDKISHQVMAAPATGTKYFVMFFYLAGMPGYQARTTWPRPEQANSTRCLTYMFEIPV